MKKFTNYLAEQGFDVTAVDISRDALDKLKKSARGSRVLVNTRLQDISKLDFWRNWDAVISIATLHLLKAEGQGDAITCMKSATKENGINLITIFTKDDIGYREYPDLSFINLEELRKYYYDWEILIAENYTKDENHGGPHSHHMAVLVARKP